MIEFIIIAVSFYIVISFYLIYAFYKRDLIYESHITNINNFLTQLATLITDIETTIERVDSQGHFRTDDEVEDFFNALKSIKTELLNFKVDNVDSLSDDSQK